MIQKPILTISIAISQVLSITGRLNDVQAAFIDNISIVLVVIILSMPLVYLVRSYFDVSQQDTTINRNKTVLPPSDKFLKIYFFVVGKLLAIPGLFYAVYKFSCDQSVPQNANEQTDLVNMYSKNLVCIFSASGSVKVLNVLATIVLLIYPFAGYYFRILEFDRRIKTHSDKQNIK